MLPLDAAPTAAPAIVLGALASVAGWPIVRGGSQRLSDALGAYLLALGGEIETGCYVRRLDELPPSQAVLADVTPRQLIAIAGDRLLSGYCRALERYRYGPGICKVDFALEGPIPWRSRECALAATVHLGGAFEEIAASEAQVWRGELPERPFVLVSQPSLFDATRAPTGKHTVWAYCHLPNGAECDLSDRIEAQIERFAPGCRGRILGKHVMTTSAMQAHNPNNIGGDINGGVQDLLQLFTRPTFSLDPYRTPAPGLYICSASTPPGGGVHGLCGYFAARATLHHTFGMR
jgi:phytoene dehydrogenase-like protein